MNKKLGDVLKSTITAEENMVQRKPLTLEQKLAAADKLSNSTSSEEAVKATTSKTSDRAVTKTFTFRQLDIDLLDNIIDRFFDIREKINKSEVLKLGLHVLSTMSNDELKEALRNIERLTPGRK
jgi:hypothetical protein